MEDLEHAGRAPHGLVLPWLRRLQRLMASSVVQPGVRPRGNAPPPLDALTTGLTVLVADDDLLNRMRACEMLERLDMRPLQAADGAEAVALAAEMRLDMILMDLQMPVLDGLGATGQIRRAEQRAARARVPVVAYSALTGNAAWLARHGFDDALDKPCELRALRACLLRWGPARGHQGRPTPEHRPREQAPRQGRGARP